MERYKHLNNYLKEKILNGLDKLIKDNDIWQGMYIQK